MSVMQGGYRRTAPRPETDEGPGWTSPKVPSSPVLRTPPRGRDTVDGTRAKPRSHVMPNPRGGRQGRRIIGGMVLAGLAVSLVGLVPTPSYAEGDDYPYAG